MVDQLKENEQVRHTAHFTEVQLTRQVQFNKYEISGSHGGVQVPTLLQCDTVWIEEQSLAFQRHQDP